MASRQVTGSIARVSSKPFKDNRSGEDITLFSFQLDGSNQWFRTGTNPIQAGVGQSVKFVADGANVEKGSMVAVASVAQQAPAPVAQAATQASNAPTASTSSTARRQSAGNKEDYWSAKEARDVEKDHRYQTVAEPRMALSVAVQAAAQVVCKALDKDAIGFGTAKKADKLGLLSGYVKEVALDLASFIHDAPEQLKAYKPSKGAVVDSGDTATEVQE
jgi:hypothetical protein